MKFLQPFLKTKDISTNFGVGWNVREWIVMDAGQKTFFFLSNAIPPSVLFYSSFSPSSPSLSPLFSHSSPSQERTVT
jgi:hypothetical protein